MKMKKEKIVLDYKKELESAAKSMILIHDPQILIKMIVRMIVQKVGVKHTGILLYDKEKNTYIFTVSRGTADLKVPAGLARMDPDNPLIRFFTERYDKKIFGSEGVLEAKRISLELKNKKHKPAILTLLNKVSYQLEMFEAVACVPSFFRDNLLGILLLGEKKDNSRFKDDELNFFTALASDVAMAIRNARLFRELELELDKKKRLFIHTTVALAAAIDAKDHYTHGHTSRVVHLSLEIAKKLMQKNKSVFDEKFLENLHIAGLLHDIGKIAIPESILNKEGPLNDEEKKRMEEHPLRGVTILEPIKELEDAVLGVKYHHEKYDGSGYPEGLKGDKIPLIASIISVADTFDAIITNRPYHQALSKKEAVEEIERVSGKQLHPQVATALLELFREGKI